MIQYNNHQRLRIIQAVTAQNIQLLPKTQVIELKRSFSTQQSQLVDYLVTSVRNLGQI